jgi:ribosomal protein S13
MIVLIVDIFARSVLWLIIGLIIVIYAFFRCFSAFAFHDTELAVFHGIGRAIGNVAVKLGLKVSTKVKDFQESDKKAMVEQLKDKVVPDEQTKLERAEQKAMKEAYYIFDCPGCKQKVRIPNRGKKGRVAIVCPACQTRFVRMRW